MVLILSWYLSAAASDLSSAASALCRNSLTCSRSSLRSWVTVWLRCGWRKRSHVKVIQQHYLYWERVGGQRRW